MKSQSPVSSFPSKLPNVGTTIFTVMSALAVEHKAINLGQGFPDFACDPALTDAVSAAMRAGHNQYPPMAGVAALRQAVAGKIEAVYGQRYDWNTEITITAGATQALFTVVACCVGPGDEVIVLEPVYDSYIPSIETVGGKVVRIALDAPDYEIPFERIAAAITPRTRLLMINTPHNPSGTVWSAGSMRKLEEMLRGTDVLLCSDEVYEHMVYDGQRHESVARYPELARRSFIVSSFGKTYHVTGWKVGYVAAPAELSAEFRKVHQFNVFTVNTPMQQGLADYMRDPVPYMGLADFYQKKRDLLRAGLEAAGFRLLRSGGTFFQCVDYTGLPIPEAKLSEADFCRWLTAEVGVAAIPLSAFYAEPKESGVVRFCFAKEDATLKLAGERLRAKLGAR
ncbi:MAG: pyridoxal phosphate-dependent aminotransferase [Candidatus Protistobacter heckmanni]|nr:pyridoxal phosphate-dependent aminotransferase [Candidatus Protistobacter heckmanni]